MASVKNRYNKSNKRNKRNNQTKTKKLSQSELKVICGKSANTFNQFEKAFEKSSNFDLIKDHKNIEQELVKLFHRPFTPSHINQKNDYKLN